MYDKFFRMTYNLNHDVSNCYSLSTSRLYSLYGLLRGLAHKHCYSYDVMDCIGAIIYEYLRGSMLYIKKRGYKSFSFLDTPCRRCGFDLTVTIYIRELYVQAMNMFEYDLDTSHEYNQILHNASSIRLTQELLNNKDFAINSKDWGEEDKVVAIVNNMTKTLPHRIMCCKKSEVDKEVPIALDDYKYTYGTELFNLISVDFTDSTKQHYFADSCKHNKRMALMLCTRPFGSIQ